MTAAPDHISSRVPSLTCNDIASDTKRHCERSVAISTKHGTPDTETRSPRRYPPRDDKLGTRGAPGSMTPASPSTACPSTPMPPTLSPSTGPLYLLPVLRPLARSRVASRATGSLPERSWARKLLDSTIARVGTEMVSVNYGFLNPLDKRCPSALGWPSLHQSSCAIAARNQHLCSWLQPTWYSGAFPTAAPAGRPSC